MISHIQIQMNDLIPLHLLALHLKITELLTHAAIRNLNSLRLGEGSEFGAVGTPDTSSQNDCNGQLVYILYTMSKISLLGFPACFAGTDQGAQTECVWLQFHVALSGFAKRHWWFC